MMASLLKDQVSSCATLRTRRSIYQPPQQSPAGLLAFAFRPNGLVLSHCHAYGILQGILLLDST
jgi:hypothetical protein